MTTATLHVTDMAKYLDIIKLAATSKEHGHALGFLAQIYDAVGAKRVDPEAILLLTVDLATMLIQFTDITIGNLFDAVLHNAGDEAQSDKLVEFLRIAGIELHKRDDEEEPATN